MMRRHLLLLDTGPIRELVSYRAVQDLRLEYLRGDLSFLRERREYEKFALFLAQFSAKTTTASVVAELYRWIRGNKQQISTLWELAYDEFKKMNMHEEVVKLLEMERELVVQCGPADASLLSLAQRHAGADPTVITSDRKLWRECSRVEVDAFHVDEIMEFE